MSAKGCGDENCPYPSQAKLVTSLDQRNTHGATEAILDRFGGFFIAINDNHGVMNKKSWEKKLVDSLASGPYGELKLLFLYGSNVETSDTDYLAVYEGQPSTPCVLLGGLDMWVLTQQDFSSHIQQLEPLVTEPLLTGELVFGSQAELSEATELLNRTSASPEITQHLLRRSLEAYVEACGYVERACEPTPQLNRAFWSTLLFAISYWVLAHEYQTNWTRPLTCEEAIRAMSTEVKAFWDTVKRNKSERSAIDRQALVTWAQFLLQC